MRAKKRDEKKTKKKQNEYNSHYNFVHMKYIMQTEIDNGRCLSRSRARAFHTFRKKKKETLNKWPNEQTIK